MTSGTARINCGISFYIARDTPTPEIEQVIGWLTDIKQDCDFKISQLEKLLAERQRADAWRKNVNSLAKQFYDPDSLHLDIETRIQIVQQRLAVEPHIARHIAQRVQCWAKRKRRENRNAQILVKHDAGWKIPQLAKNYKLSRQQVHNIVKNRRDQRFLK